MTPRESAQDFSTLLRKLMATKLTASTAIALLEESADVIEGLVNELGDQDPGGPGNDELDGILAAMYVDVRRWVAANVLVPELTPDPVADGTAIPPMGAADSRCGEFLYEVRRTWRCSADADHPLTWHVEHSGDGQPVRYWPVRDGETVIIASCDEAVSAPGQYCPACQLKHCDMVRPHIAAEFPPATPELPWLCAECAAPTGIRCWSGFTHDRDVPVCVSHSVPVPGLGDDRECIGCANHRDDAAAVPASLALVQGLADGGAK